MRIAVWAGLGLVVGTGLVFLIGISLPQIVSISQAEGAYATGVAFFWAPVGGLTGAIAGGILGMQRRGR